MGWKAKAGFCRTVICLRFPVCLLSICWLACGALAESAKPKKQVIVSAGAVHSLSAAEAKLALPVDFRGVVTFYSPEASCSLFVSDATGGVFLSISCAKPLPVKEGTEVEVTGVTWPGDFAPIVGKATLRVLGQTRVMPPAPRVSVIEMSAGLHDSERVEVLGLIRSVTRVGPMVSLKILTHDGPIAGLMVAQPGERYEKLVDATIQVRGVAGVEFNTHMQMTGAHLLIASLADVQVLRWNEKDPFELPPRNVIQLARFDKDADLAARVHLRGRVTLQWPGRLLCLEDATGGLCVETHISDPHPAGSSVDLVGYPVYASQIPGVTDVQVRASRVDHVLPVAPLLVTSKRVMEGDDSAQLISLEGELVGLSSEAQMWQLTIASQGVVFNATLPKDSGSWKIEDWRVGSYVRLTGVCANDVDPRVGLDWSTHQKLASFRLMMRSGNDVVVLRKPSFWTPAHTSITLGSAGLLTAAVFVWVVMLRRQVEQRTRQLQDSEKRFRHLAHHDTLTGLPNRAWFHECANRALDLSKRSGKCVGLLLLDLDHFKPINDTMGHDAGDAMLCALAERATGAVRRVDTVARLGGDEFAVVLGELNDAADASRIAQKLLEAVCRPVAIKGQEVGLSTSIGIAVFPEDGDTVTELLRSADLAMYESKRALRGGMRRFRHEMMSDHAHVS